MPVDRCDPLYMLELNRALLAERLRDPQNWPPELIRGLEARDRVVANARRASGARKGEPVTPNELLETVVRKYPLGHPIVSIAVTEYNFWYESDIDGYYVLETVLDELPDISPRTGDCAELLDM